MKKVDSSVRGVKIEIRMMHYNMKFAPFVALSSIAVDRRSTATS